MCVFQLFATPWSVAHQAPLCMGFPRQEYWSGFQFSSLGDLPDPGIKPTYPASPALVCTWEARKQTSVARNNISHDHTRFTTGMKGWFNI